MLELKNIKKDYYVGDTVVNALKGVNLTFRNKEFVSILGPSGCGKTTLLNIIGGLDHYTSGDLIIDNISTKKFKDRDWDTYRNHRIGFIFQSYNLIPHQTILENVELALTISGLKKEERVKKAKKALDEVGLKDLYNKKGNQLSGGQQQRVAIARALVNEPDILLADEPTGALDSQTSIQIMGLMKEISKNKLVIMVTHNPELAYKYSTRIIKLKDGLKEDDSNPLSEEELVKESQTSNKREISKKAKLNFIQTFRLSFRNLISKFKRTSLVAFAGSIGIIGVSSVLAVSTGIQNYIYDMENDMLSGNPITISTETYDLSSLLNNLSFKEQTNLIENATENGVINVQYLLESLIESSGLMTDISISNDISKDYINYLENMDPNLYADITYDYGLTFLNNIYTDIDFTNYENTKMSISGILNTYTAMLQKTDFGSYSPFVTSIAKPFDQSLNNVDYILEQYDIVSDPSISHLPTKENEIMIVLSSDDALTDIVLGELGYYSQDEFFNIVYRANGDDDRYNEDLDKDHFSLDELMDKTFTYYPNDAVFNETPNSLLGPFTYNAYEEDISDTSNKIDLEITAILKPKEGVSYGSLSSGFYYTEALASRMREDSANSKITNYIKAHDNVITSSMGILEMPGPDGSLVETPYVNGITYNYHYYFEGKEYPDNQNIGLVGTMNLSGASNKMISYDLTLEDVGGASLPSSISIYPKNFELKDQIVDYLNEWNEDKTIEVNGVNLSKDQRSEIIYSDNLQLIIDLLNTMINMVTYALIAFTALSLVVSTVMIAIITYVSVIERVKEIGVIRALGGRKKDVSRLFYSETIIEGLSSGVLGILVTYLLSFILNMIVGSLTGIYTIAFLTWYQALIMIVLSVALTAISGIIPAKLAARKDPAEALRTE